MNNRLHRPPLPVVPAPFLDQTGGVDLADVGGALPAELDPCGLVPVPQVRAITGVDPAPFKTWLLPRLSRMSPRLRLTALAGVTALSLPIDVLFGRMAVGPSWHAVFVLRHARGADAH